MTVHSNLETSFIIFIVDELVMYFSWTESYKVYISFLFFKIFPSLRAKMALSNAAIRESHLIPSINVPVELFGLIQMILHP